MEKKEKNKLIVAGVVGVLFFVFGILVQLGITDKIDAYIYSSMKVYLISDNLTWYMKFITNGFGIILIPLFICILPVIIKKKKLWYYLMLDIVGAGSITWIVKNIIRRQRPIENQLVIENGYSFPSAHSMINLAFYGYLIYFINANVKSKKIKDVLIILLTMIILQIGMSRIYLGVHYFSDVIGGFLLGIFYLLIFISVINVYEKNIDNSNKQKKQSNLVEKEKEEIKK